MSGLAEGIYFIRNVASGTMLDAGGPPESKNKTVGWKYAYENIDRQLWDVKLVGIGKYVVFLHGTSNVVDLEEANPKNGTPILSFPVHYGNNQVWRIENKAGAYRMVGVSSDKSIDLTDGKGGDGTPVIINSNVEGSTSQLWEFKKVGPLVGN